MTEKYVIYRIVYHKIEFHGSILHHMWEEDIEKARVYHSQKEANKTSREITRFGRDIVRVTTFEEGKVLQVMKS